MAPPPRPQGPCPLLGGAGRHLAAPGTPALWHVGSVPRERALGVQRPQEPWGRSCCGGRRPPPQPSLKARGGRREREACFCPSDCQLSFRFPFWPGCPSPRAAPARRCPQCPQRAILCPSLLPVPAQPVSLSLHSSPLGLCLENLLRDPSAPVSFHSLWPQSTAPPGPHRSSRGQLHSPQGKGFAGDGKARGSVGVLCLGASPKGTPPPKHLPHSSQRSQRSGRGARTPGTGTSPPHVWCDVWGRVT